MMGLESKITSNQMLSCSFLIKNTPPSWMALLALFLLFSSYLLLGIFGYFSILYTSLLAVFFSTVFYITAVSKHKAVEVIDHESLEEEVLCPPEEGSSDQRENIAPTKHEALTEESKEEQDDANNYSATSSSPDLIFQEKLSTPEDSEEVDWPFPYAVDLSDTGSISDEESLIEIALPTGHYVANNCCLQQQQQQKKRELSSAAEALFSHQSLMEFLSELNDVSEEENLIEIDISMGSIKYSSRFEIKA